MRNSPICVSRRDCIPHASSGHIDAAARAFQGMRHDITAVQVRLGVLGDKLHPAAYITDAQAAEVSS